MLTTSCCQMRAQIRLGWAPGRRVGGWCCPVWHCESCPQVFGALLALVLLLVGLQRRHWTVHSKSCHGAPHAPGGCLSQWGSLPLSGMW